VVPERIRASIEGFEFDVGEGNKARLRASIGYCLYPFFPESPEIIDGEQVFKVADRALYVAKDSGRNAWVGLHRTPRTPKDGILDLVDNDLERGVLEGWLAMECSLEDLRKVVWARE
jgi:hypothetical protein